MCWPRVYAWLRAKIKGKGSGVQSERVWCYWLWILVIFLFQSEENNVNENVLREYLYTQIVKSVATSLSLAFKSYKQLKMEQKWHMITCIFKLEKYLYYFWSLFFKNFKQLKI